MMPNGKRRHERSYQEYRPDAGEPTLWCKNPFRRRVPLAVGARQETLPHARRRKGLRRWANQNARKHGLFTRDAIEERREIQVLLGEARKLLEEMK